METNIAIPKCVLNDLFEQAKAHIDEQYCRDETFTVEAMLELSDDECIMYTARVNSVIDEDVCRGDYLTPTVYYETHEIGVSFIRDDRNNYYADWVWLEKKLTDYFS